MQLGRRLLGGAMAGLALALVLASPTFAQKDKTGTAIEYGDDSSRWANDGECDDPRFVGAGAAEGNVYDDAYKDATDCQAAVAAGTVTLELADASGIDFGDDTSTYANDNECDDPRFRGTASGLTDDPTHLKHDATDCRTAYEGYKVAYAPADTSGVDFGDDTSQWANDGECDDPRFVGRGAASENVEADLMKDATDCLAAYEGFAVVQRLASTSALDFGDDTSQWANDGECDDPRFVGSGAATENVEADRLKDATDCIAAFEAATVSVDTAGVDFGTDTGSYVNDRECDDQRFSGPGVAEYTTERASDMTDCRNLYASGQVVFKPAYAPEYAAGAPYDSSSIDFGDNTSSYSDNGECDDPRFDGPGSAMTLLDEDTLHDANDCKAKFEAGEVVLR